jgi:hypothetical protein
MHAGYRACGDTMLFSEDPARRPLQSKILLANVDSRLLSEANESLLEPGVGSLASHLHQMRKVVLVCVELVGGTQLGHDLGCCGAVY